MAAINGDQQTYPVAAHAAAHARTHNGTARGATPSTHGSWVSMDDLEQLVESQYLRNLVTEMMPRPSRSAT